MKQSTYDLWCRIFIAVTIACTLLSAFFLYQGYTARQQQAELQANVDQLVSVTKVVEPTRSEKINARQQYATSNTELKDATYIVHHQDLIKGTLKDPDSAEFKNSFVSRLIGAPVVCGYVNAKNAFGGYTGFERFISGGSIQVVESQMAAGEMNKTWRTVCGQ